VTTIRNLLGVALLVIVAAVVLSAGNFGKGGGTGNDDEGKRVTLEINVRDFKPGANKPRAHYRTMNVAPQPEQISHDDGIPVDDDGHFRKSLGMVKKGTYVMLWATIPGGVWPEGMFVECKIFVNGNLESHDTNVGDAAVVCEKEIV
jgi:hypothetical protein